METPSSDASPVELPGSDAGSRGVPRRLSDDAARLLLRAVVPVLERRKDRGLSRTVRTAVREGATDLLADLPERERRSLLEALEKATSKKPRPRDARAVVELTAFLGGVPEPEVRLSRWRTVPAR